MSVKTYKYNDKTQLSTHFNVQEFRCKCGKNHDILIDTDLVDLLENAMKQLGAKVCNITSGHRCAAHDKAVGGKGSGNHVNGQAADHYFKDVNGKIIDGQTVCLGYEDMGHKKGIAYRCGGSKPEKGIVHADVCNRKWYGDESKSMTASIGDSFYPYFGKTKKVAEATVSAANTVTTINKTLTTAVYGRNGVGFKYKKTLYKKGTKVNNCTMNVGKANGYTWFYGYVGNTKVYFPYKESWYK